MADLTRRSFLTRTSVGVAGGVLAGAMAAEVTSLVSGSSQMAGKSGPSGAAATEPLIAHVRDVSRGEIALMVGTREVIYKDRELAARLMVAAQQTAGR
jgi:hypothetical protein